MRINSKDKIANIPILDVRKLLKHGSFTRETVQRTLKVNANQAEDLINELVSRGLIEEENLHGETGWTNTMNGRRLSQASAAKPVKRTTAKRAIEQFMERVAEANTNPYYLYKVEKVILFGSYLSDSPTVNDVDLALEIVRKTEDPDQFMALVDQRSKEAQQNGRRFGSYIDQLYWPFTEVFLFLKSRSRTLSLHSKGLDKEVLANTETLELYPEQNEIP